MQVCPRWYVDARGRNAYVLNPDVGHLTNRIGAVSIIWLEEVDAYREHDLLLVLTCHPLLGRRPTRLRANEKPVKFADECGHIEFSRCDSVAERVPASETIPDRRPE